jgi:hypothetical protein
MVYSGTMLSSRRGQQRPATFDDAFQDMVSLILLYYVHAAAEPQASCAASSAPSVEVRDFE